MCAYALYVYKILLANDYEYRSMRSKLCNFKNN